MPNTFIHLRRLLPLSIFILLSAYSHKAEARHIIAAQMYYTKLGTTDYLFTMEIYRDCNCTDCADFDSRVNFGIYHCNMPCPGQSQSAPFRNVQVDVNSIEQVPPHPSSHCVATGACYEKAIYRFTVNLPVSNQSYFVVYQRCCYAEQFANLPFSSQVGTTVYTEITPAVQQMPNKISPRYPFTPVLELCVGQPFSFDLRCPTPDNTDLSYHFVCPLAGGGNILSSPGYNTCDGASPSPGCPPPFASVAVNVPTFTCTQPFVTNSSLALNAGSGLLTGVPNILGKFLASYRVSEMVNGEYVADQRILFSVSVVLPSGVGEVEAASGLFSIAPNPTSDRFVVRPRNIGAPFKVSVFHIDGRLIRCSAPSFNEFEVDGLPSGLYIILIEQAGKRYFAKMAVTGNEH